MWGDRRGSNSRPRDYKSRALPIELLPPQARPLDSGLATRINGFCFHMLSNIMYIYGHYMGNILTSQWQNA